MWTIVIPSIIITLTIGIVWSIARYVYTRKNSEPSTNKITRFIFDEKITDNGISLLLTIGGVILALLLTNIDDTATDRSNANTILSALSDEFHEVEGHITEVFLPIIQQMQDDGAHDADILYLYNAQPLVPLVTFSIAMNSELLIANVQPSMYGALLSAYRSSITSFERLQNVDSVEDFIFELYLLQETLLFAQSIVDSHLENNAFNGSRRSAFSIATIAISTVACISAVTWFVLKLIANHTSKHLLAKTQFNHSKKLESFKNDLSKINYVSKTRFDAEFEIFRRLNEAYFNLIRDVLSISPLTYENITSNETEKTIRDDELFQVAYNSFRVAQNQLYQNDAFIDKSMSVKFSDILLSAQLQIFDFRRWSNATEEQRYEANIVPVERIKEILEMHGVLIDDMRIYLKSLEVLT